MMISTMFCIDTASDELQTLQSVIIEINRLLIIV